MWHELRDGATYQVVLSTSGGLWRYRLGDLVRVDGFLGATPSLKFLARAGITSDRFGEKLSEVFVGHVLREATASARDICFLLLAPDEDSCGCRYTLYGEGRLSPEIADCLDRLLRKNPHYNLCRNLGQLQAVRLFLIAEGGYEAFVTRECENGKRLGDVKPCSLSLETDWSRYFKGSYVVSGEES